jgi:hypothetical protein
MINVHVIEHDLDKASPEVCTEEPKTQAMHDHPTGKYIIEYECFMKPLVLDRTAQVEQANHVLAFLAVNELHAYCAEAC